MAPRVELERLSELLPHEEVSRPRALLVARSIASTGAVLRPIIVEESSLAIIDGHHRYTALKMLGARYAPVVRARYGGSIQGIDPPRRILRVRASGPEEALMRVAEAVEASREPGPSRVVLALNGLRVALSGSPESLHRILGSLASQAPRGSGRLYAVRAVLEPLRPRDVVEAALRGEAYPPKTTLHRTPLKALYSPVKLSALL